MRASERSSPDGADIARLLGNTSDGMVSVAPGGEIASWNDGAARLLGYEPEEVIGRQCFEVFAWLDRCGNPVCSVACPHCRAPGGEEVVETRDVIARTKEGKAVWLSVSTLVPPPELRRTSRLVHMFREVGLPPELERLVAERISPNGADAEVARDEEKAAALARLTRREREVLALLAEGADSDAIADRLTLSHATVRNHVQNVLTKLGVHSRLEAAVLFVRYGQ